MGDPLHPFDPAKTYFLIELRGAWIVRLKPDGTIARCTERKRSRHNLARYAKAAELRAHVNMPKAANLRIGLIRIKRDAADRGDLFATICHP